jgi:protein dithiol oxidoreductase (disulfide-forming)
MKSSKSIMIFFILLFAGIIGYIFYAISSHTHTPTNVPEPLTAEHTASNNQIEKPYKILTQDIPSQLLALPANQIRIIEFFNYACPHCRVFEPYLTAWKKQHADLLQDKNTLPQTAKTSNLYLVFDKIPVTFGPDWQHYSEAFYIADTAKILTPELNALLFSLSSIDGLKTDTQMRSFFSHHGVTEQAYNQITQSPAFSQRQNADAQLEKALKITAIPTLLVIKNNQVYEINPAMPQSLIDTLTLLTKSTQPNL